MNEHMAPQVKALDHWGEIVEVLANFQRQLGRGWLTGKGHY
jgi:hypothetical protein